MVGGVTCKMCILFLDYEPECSSNRPYLLIAASNRDEYYHRRTLPAAYWQDHPHVLAGRDVHKSTEGGTWLGITKDGRFSVLTNYRTRVVKPDAPSRGGLVSGFLLGASSPHDYSAEVLEQGDQYNGFNLVTATLGGSPGEAQLAYCTNKEDTPVKRLGAGVYGLGNQLLDSPWGKLVHGRERFRQVVSGGDDPALVGGGDALTQRLMDEVLSDTTCFFPDKNVPNYGYSDGVMKCLNSVFVSKVGRSDGLYGTRTQTVVLVSRSGEVSFTERTLDTATAAVGGVGVGEPVWQTRTFTFTFPISQGTK